MSMGGAVVAASLATAGALSVFTVLLPAIYLMGNPVQECRPLSRYCRSQRQILPAYYRGLRHQCAAVDLGHAAYCFNKELSCLIYPPRVYLVTGRAPVYARRPGHL